MAALFKDAIFQSFLVQWGEEFNRLPDLLRLLDTYHSMGSDMDKFERIEAHELDESQMEWISLVERFEHPLEKEFFKSYGVPISKDNYEYFLDLSVKPFRIFETGYYRLRPVRGRVSGLRQQSWFHQCRSFPPMPWFGLKRGMPALQNEVIDNK